MMPQRSAIARTIRNVMFDRPVETMSRKDRRKQRKRALWLIDPRCHECGCRLTIEAAHLVNDALTCADCEQAIRIREAEKQNQLYRTIQNRSVGVPEDVQLELTPKAKRWLATRQARSNQLKNRDKKNKLRRELVEAGHRCDCCSCQLSSVPSDPNYAHLVMGRRLSCSVHVKIVERRCRMDAVSEAVTMTV